MAGLKVYSLDNLPDTTKTLFLSNMDTMLTDASAGKLATYKQLKWWEKLPEGKLNPPITIPAPHKVLTFWHIDGTPFVPQPLTVPVNWNMKSGERHGNLFSVFDKDGIDLDWYCKAEDLPVPA